MKSIVLAFLLSIIALKAFSSTPISSIASGSQPQITIDTKGVIRLVFGRADSIFCATSIDAGQSFSKPVFVGYVKNMHLGMTRGPQIASSLNFSILTAMDKSGDIHYFQLNHATDKWANKGLLNASTAPEGLMSITTDKRDNFYAVWLDIRHKSTNNIAFATLNANKDKWQNNRIIYISPNEHVCECCKPSIAVNGNEIGIMFRNWIDEARDLYLITSSNHGQSFTDAQKLGVGSWQLKACPMDGGGIIIDNQHIKHSVWRREDTIYYCKANEKEMPIGKARLCSINYNNKNNKLIISMTEGENVKIFDVGTKSETLVGKGSFLKSIILPDNQLLCVWEENKTIKCRKI